METNGTFEKNLLWYSRTKTSGHRFFVSPTSRVPVPYSLLCHVFPGDEQDEFVKGRIERDSGILFYVGVRIHDKVLVDGLGRPIYDSVIYLADKEEELPTLKGMGRIVKRLQKIHTEINEKDYGNPYNTDVTRSIRRDVEERLSADDCIVVEAGKSDEWLERPVFDLRTKKENKMSENTATINTPVETPVAAKPSLWSRFKGFMSNSGGVIRNVAVGVLVAPTIVGLVGLGLGLLATGGPSILGTILSAWLGRGVGIACKVLLGVGAVVAGFFGSWLVCGWLALNALAV